MPDSNGRSGIVERVFIELEQLVTDLRNGMDFTLFQQSFDRWKRRSVDELKEKVSITEAERFRSIQTRASWISMDDGFDPIVREHSAFLVALHKDLEEHPERYPVPSPRQIKAQRRSQASRGAEQLALPEKVTLRWMFRHVPIATWGVLITSLIASFSLGFKLAQNPTTSRIIGALLGTPSLAEVPSAPSAR